MFKKKLRIYFLKCQDIKKSWSTLITHTLKKYFKVLDLNQNLTYFEKFSK